jgi:hypothetical protein
MHSLSIFLAHTWTFPMPQQPADGSPLNDAIAAALGMSAAEVSVVCALEALAQSFVFYV